ncbi:hypothetical protein DPMN_055359 [Dreissena polymorpha]|uniref:Uncharacterized protein n=1 Tax=Dreissena polymorpha TaxID=45954 RepID=A0A9D4CR89_DREPO|nr:hypothetical protein DPMN_055359 [Dreissena polymorpha]
MHLLKLYVPVAIYYQMNLKHIDKQMPPKSRKALFDNEPLEVLRKEISEILPKLAPGFNKNHGDQDLFGHEEENTLKMRYERIGSETASIYTMYTLIDEWQELSDDEKCQDDALETLITTEDSEHDVYQNSSFKLDSSNEVETTINEGEGANDRLANHNNAYAKRIFSSDDENAMRSLSYGSEADFCKLVRQWYEAEDMPGLSAPERCKVRLAFKDSLLRDVDFNVNPPPGKYIKGFPKVMFKGFVRRIDTSF